VEGEGEVAAMEHRLLASTVVMDSSSMEEEEDTVHRLSSKARMAVDMVVRLLRVSSKADMVRLLAAINRAAMQVVVSSRRTVGLLKDTVVLRCSMRRPDLLQERTRSCGSGSLQSTEITVARSTRRSSAKHWSTETGRRLTWTRSRC